MYYFSQKAIETAIIYLKDNKLSSKFIGLLSILHSIKDDQIIVNKTYKVRDLDIGNWLNDVMSLVEPSPIKLKSFLYVKFALSWSNYVSESIFQTKLNLYSLIVFIYKFVGFEEKPTFEYLLNRFMKDFHLSIKDIDNWFNKENAFIEVSENVVGRSALASLLKLKYETLTFEGEGSVKAKASELGRAPFVQTLYAGMDSIKCLLISREDLESLYPSKSESFKLLDLLPSRQIICYGAPGTGKSHKIKHQLELENVPEENIFRATFHPDSDYSTFVGAYKPTMENDEPLYNKGQLISKLTELNTQGVSYAAQKFGAKYWYSLRRLTPSDEKEILQACGMKESLTVEIDKGVAVGEALLQRKDSRIVYGFVPQVFLNAYTQAYKKPNENIYLIIEEINRGNCAQIFGDLFQLLDRDENGISEYPIKADTDVKTFLESELGVDNPGIKDGELCLPSNLYIYATMNTSDQSLFPIDSAFKRRWDWEYEPIKYENTDWVIDIQGEKYLWTSFQKEVNRRIFEAANSEDKQLGDYFVNPRNGVITENILVNKILFYLWNDVCKDGEGDIFKVSDTEDVSFSELYIDKGKLIKLMDYLHVEKSMNGDKDQSSENEEESDEEGATTPQSV